MRIPSNKIQAVIAFYRDELKDVYDADEATAIAFYCLNDFFGITRTSILKDPDLRITESDMLRVTGSIKKLKKGEPVQYVTGRSEFYGLKLKVNTSVLIPRPETEELVDLVVRENKEHQKPINFLDVCTGSGCIALALKFSLPAANVTALDISEEALAVARENARNNSVDVNFFKADALALPPLQVDVIISNPPYVTRAEKKAMKANVLEYEPHLALFVDDDDPLKFYMSIGSWGVLNLTGNGRIYFEVNEAYAGDVAGFLKSEGYRNVEIVKDLSSKERFVKAIK